MATLGDFTEKALESAKENGMVVYIIGHQPLTTKKGKDEYDTESEQFISLKQLLTKYSPIIKVGLFGHRNVAGFGEVLNKDFLPIFPSLTAPGVSPRGRNQPSFNVIYQSKVDSTGLRIRVSVCMIVFVFSVNNLCGLRLLILYSVTMCLL